MTNPNQPSLFDVGSAPSGDPLARVPSEIAKRDAVLASHEDNYRDVLRSLRVDMEILYRQRFHAQGHAACVTADDARQILATHEAFEGMTFASMNWLGQLFRDGNWEQTGQTIRSQTPGSHGNVLPCWRLKESSR